MVKISRYCHPLGRLFLQRGYEMDSGVRMYRIYNVYKTN